MTPLLAVIDMQRVFGEPDSQWLAPRFTEIVGPVRRLVGAFQPRVIFTRFVAPAVPAGAWRRYYDQWPFALQPAGARIYELVDEFAGQPGRTLDATTFSKWGPELAGLTGGPGGDPGQLVLAGVSTDCCVLSTALAAADAGVSVRVVADACAGVTDESHRQALDILRLYGPLVEVVSVTDIVDEAGRAAGTMAEAGPSAGRAAATAGEAGPTIGRVGEAGPTIGRVGEAGPAAGASGEAAGGAGPGGALASDRAPVPPTALR
jgi:nicotinamidase-related amidase